MKTSLAAIYEGVPRSIAARRLPTPSPDAGEILVRVLGCTLCGSDVHSFEGRRSVPVPTVLGHEIVGRIEAFGASAKRVDLGGCPVAVGDRVTWAIVAECGECFSCRHDLPQKCASSVKYGHEAFRPRRELTGGFAEHCLLAPATSLVKIPEGMPLEVACPASCATATVVAAFEAAGSVDGATVGILGAGMLGLTACAMAKSLGAARVVCVEPTPERRARAVDFGSDFALEALDPEVVRGWGDGRGFDAAIELSGNPSSFRAAWPLIRTGGTMVLVGSVFPSEPTSIALEDVVRRCLTLKGVHNYAPRHLAKAITFLEKERGRYPFASLVASWFPLSDIAAAFEAGSRSKAARIGVRPDA